MVATAHILAGAATAKTVRNKPVGLAAAFLVHQALDLVPHIDSHGLFGSPAGLTRMEILASSVDAGFGCVLLFFLIRRLADRTYLAAGAFMGILMDLLDNYPLWSGAFRTSLVGSWVSAYHHALQNNLQPNQWLLGLTIQTITLVACALILRRGDK